MSEKALSPREICEAFLNEEIRSNEEKEILPSEVKVARRLLTRGAEMTEVYEEVMAHLSDDGVGWKVFLGCLLSTGAFWSSEKIANYRAGRARLIETNQAIAQQALALSELLEHREDLHNYSAFGSETLYDIVTLIDRASAQNGRYESYVKTPLAELSARYDMKYWPTLAECLRVLGEDANNAEVRATDPMTEAATRSPRASKADTIRALRESIDENRGSWWGSIPKNFRLPDNAMAQIANVLLELAPEDMIDANYIKSLRHRDKTYSGSN